MVYRVIHLEYRINRIADATIPCDGCILQQLLQLQLYKLGLELSRFSVAENSGSSASQLNIQIADIGVQTVVVLAEVDICLQGKSTLCISLAFYRSLLNRNGNGFYRKVSRINDRRIMFYLASIVLSVKAVRMVH